MGLPEIIIMVAGSVLAIILLVIIVLVFRRLASGPHYSALHNIRRFLVVTACVLLAILVFCVLGVMWPLGIVGWIVLIFVVAEGVRKSQAGRQYGLMWLLTVSAERSMPLAPAIEAFARERGGSFGRRAKRLAEMLDAGVSLPNALDRCPGLLPASALTMIRVGCETGSLAQALRRAATNHDPDEPIWAAMLGKIAYLLALPAYGVLILTFIMLKIVPSFEKIFKDFGTTLPAMTQTLIKVSYFAINYWFLLLPLYLLGLFLLVYLAMRYFGWIVWDLPGMGRFTGRLDSAEILDSLALVAGQQRPLPQGIAALAHSYPKKRIRWRLSQAEADITLGGDWCESLYRHDLIRQPELSMLQAAQRVGNLPWALTEMANSVRRRLAYRVQAAVQMLFPPVVILMGLVVLFIVVALFLPLVSLIQKLA